MRRVLNVVVVVAALAGAAYVVKAVLAQDRPVRIGILQSLSGTMAISEKSLVDAAELAVDEVNRDGGVLGRSVEAVVADGRSDPEWFAHEAERLIRDEHVSAVFGCWTSGSRKTVLPVIEHYHHLLFYPLQYEGLEESPDIVYLGAAPNQQIIPALKWVIGNIGRRVYLVGSDYVFPRAANAIIRAQAARWRADVVGEDYVVLGGHDVDAVVRRIVAAHPDAILNTLNGDSNVAFFTALRAAGVTAAQVPTISFSIAEEELRSLPRDAVAGDYAAWTYFQSIESPGNELFVRDFKRRYGESRVTDDPIEAAYVGVKLWAQAANAAGSVEPAAVRRAVVDRSFRAPGGMIYVDAETRHTWKEVRIGRIRADGQFQIVWSSDRPVRAEPFPSGRTRAQWQSFLDTLYRQWGSRWYNPGAAAAEGLRSLPYR